MDTIKFSEIKDELQKALEAKLKMSPIPYENGFTLLEGFMSMPIQGEIGKKMIIGGPSVPVIGIVGNTTGRIYTFALKAILPDILAKT